MAILESSSEVLAQIASLNQDCTSNSCTCDVTHRSGFGKKLMAMKGL